MNRFGIIAAALLSALCIGCSTDTTKDLEISATRFTVSLAESRTELGDKEGNTYPVYWSEGDCIVVNGEVSNPVSINADNRKSAIFDFSSSILTSPYLVTYPYTASTTASTPIVNFRAEQNYVEGTFEQGAAPMCGYSTNSVIKLKHLGGVLRFAVRATEEGKSALKTIIVTAEDGYLSGDFEVDCKNATITPTESCGKQVTYSLPDDFYLSTTDDSLFYIAVPCGKVGDCTVAFIDSNGKRIEAKWLDATIKAGVVSRFNTIYFGETDADLTIEDMTEVELADWNYDPEATIHGRVTCGGEPIEGVVVSDGFITAKTNENGYYSLRSELDGVVFAMVSIPSGYSAPTDQNGLPIFYKRIADLSMTNGAYIANFSFNKIKGDADRFTLFVGADPQPRARTAGYDNIGYHSLDCCEDFYRDMREKAATITDREVYGMMLGDIIHENMSLFDNYIAGLKTLGFPMFNILGNHDNDPTATTDVEGRRVFEAKLGPAYYSFNIGKLHFVVLDNLIMEIRESDGSLRDYSQGLTDEIWQWLQNDLKYVDESATLMVAAHSPMYKSISGSNRGGKYKAEFAELFSKYKKVHVWTGHHHTTYNYNFPSSSSWSMVEEHSVARSTGELWTNEYLAGGTPRGYTVVEVDGEDISWYFKPTIYQSSTFTTKTSKKPSYTHRDWNYNSSGVAKMRSNGSTLSESYQMKVYAPGSYHETYEDMVSAASANKYVYVNVFMWDDKWEYPKYNGVAMEKLSRTKAYCLATYEIKNHYYLYGYKLAGGTSYGPENNDIHTVFRAYDDRSSATSTITVTDRFGNNYSSTVSW